jgi:hypothetical protein
MQIEKVFAKMTAKVRVVYFALATFVNTTATEQGP